MALILAMSLSATAAVGAAAASPVVVEPPSGLPGGSELDDDAIENPREIFHSEALHGRKSYLSKLGNLAFNSPLILGTVAQRAHISCSTCHVNGAANPRFFIPGLSTRPGTFDTTNGLFNPKADNGVLDAVTIPSLRGARFLAPYGHDGRMPSLRDFVQRVIVAEFAGPPPSQDILDALAVYIEDIDFLPNPQVDAAGKLRNWATAAQRRGAELFARPFPHDPNLSCAACHVPSATFADHLQHDVGSGGLYKTPTLLNANFNAPYFHDGRFDDYTAVIQHFNRTYTLGLSIQDAADLEAYLRLIGDGMRPDYHLTGANVLADINDFASVLDVAIPAHDAAIIALTARSIGAMLEDLRAHYGAGPSDGNQGGARECALARSAIAALIDIVQRIDHAASAKHYDDAAGEYLKYRKLTSAAAPFALQSAEAWSSFNPEIHSAHALVK